ncbi:MAG: manganese efflux pump, partial [Planctomycetota bacterium]
AILGETVWAKAVVIGAVAAGLSALGITFGNRLGSRWEHRAEFLGGTVLILIGLRILVTHLWA